MHTMTTLHWLIKRFAPRWLWDRWVMWRVDRDLARHRVLDSWEGWASRGRMTYYAEPHGPDPGLPELR